MPSPAIADATVRRSLDLVVPAYERLLEWCVSQGFVGWDPYDGLNTPLARWTRTRTLQLSLSHATRLFPINLRPLLGVRKHRNPKALALIGSASLRMHSLRDHPMDLDAMREATAQLRQDQAPGYTGACWGYPFPWRSRTFLLAGGTPSVVCTAFVASFFLDAYEAGLEPAGLEVARSSCQFILHDLNRSFVEGDRYCFSYSPKDQSKITNASLLGALLLYRTGMLAQDASLRNAALPALRYAITEQRPNGAWVYGAEPNQRWVDHYHTGFILDSLDAFVRLGREEIRPVLQRGLDFYIQNLFTGPQPRFSDRRLWPADIHCCAQALLSLSRFRYSEKCLQSLDWTQAEMMSRRGLFFFRRYGRFTQRTPFLRWGQAWMLKALASIPFFGQEIPWPGTL